MPRNTYIIEEYEEYDEHTGEIKKNKRYSVHKQNLGATDKFVKMSKYICDIFRYNEIPYSLLPLTLLIAQKMDFKTNTINLHKRAKLELSRYLGFKEKYRTKKNPYTKEVIVTGQQDTNSIDKLIRELVKYDILQRTEIRGVYEMNSYLFSNGTVGQTRKLQEFYDCHDRSKKPINHETVKAAIDKMVEET